MASYFDLILDTTGPIIEVALNSYTVQGVECDITILSNEPLSSEMQNVYIADAAGKKHNLILTISADGMSYTGTANFNECAAGIATVYAQLWDEVGNISNLASASINILSESFYYCEGRIAQGDVYRELNTCAVQSNISTNKVNAQLHSSVVAANISAGMGKISIEKAVM